MSASLGFDSPILSSHPQWDNILGLFVTRHLIKESTDEEKTDSDNRPLHWLVTKPRISRTLEGSSR